MSQPYKSGRQQNLNLGITSVTENRTVLQTIGKVGIGTTNAQNHSLFVVGTTNITGDINVGGASTFVGVGTFGNNLYVANQLYVGGVNVSGGASIGEDITTRNFLASGISTFNGIIDANSDLDVAKQTTLNNLNVTGIATIQNLNVQSGFDVYDTTATFHNNVFIAGNLSIGGTATNIFAQDLKVFDKEITLGITTDAFGNDISNDITANHGGISIASTVGSPLVDLSLAGFSTLPPTYKQLMWVAANSYGVGTTDAWMFNYAVGIGSTLIPNGVYLAAGAIQATKDTLTTPNLNAVNANVTGVSTLGIVSATTLFVTGVSTFKNNVNLADNASLYLGDGNDLRIFHNGANSFIQDNGTGNLFIDASNTYYRATTHLIQNPSSSETLAVFTSNGSVALYYDNVKTFETSGIGATVYGTLDTTQLNATGIVTGSSFRPSTGYYQSANGTNAFYVYDGTGNVAFQGTIGVGQINSGQGYQAINLSSDTKPTVTFIDNGIFNGVVTARQFVGDVNVGVATINQAILTNIQATNLNVSGLSTFAGITTVTGSTLFTKQLDVSGISTFAGITTVTGSTLFTKQLDVSGIATFRSNAYFGDSDILNFGDGNDLQVYHDGSNSFVRDFGVGSLILGSDGLGVDIYNVTQGEYQARFINNGSVELYHDSIKRLETTGYGITVYNTIQAPQLNITGIGTIDGITISSGIVTSSQPGVTTVKYYGDGSNLIGVNAFNVIQQDITSSPVFPTFANSTGVTSIGIAPTQIGYVPTFGNLGIGSTNPTAKLQVVGDTLISGVVTARQFVGHVNAGVATIGLATATSVFVDSLTVGVATVNILDVNKISPDGVNFGGAQYLLRANGDGTWAWADVPGIFSVNNILNGFNVTDEGIVVGTAGSITQLDFRGNNIIASADPQPNGIATVRVSDTPNFDSLRVTGISTLGITTTTNLNAQSISVSGLSTFIGVGTFTSDLYVGGDLYVGDDLIFDSFTARQITVTESSSLGIASATTLNVTGITTTALLNVGVGGTIITTTNTTRVGINSISPNFTLDVNGDVNFNGTLYQNNSPFIASRWSAGLGNDIYRLNGDVGIGTTNPQYTLEVSGNARISGITSITNLEIYGAVSAGTTTGNSGQYLRSTGVGVTWADFPTLRTTGITTATEGQTTFSFSYSVGFIDVYVNGVKLIPSEFIASNGSSVVLNSPAYQNDIVELIGYNTVSTSGGGGGGGGASSLNDLTDVTLTSPAAGETLVYDGSQWVNDYNVTASTSTTSQTAIHTLSAATYRSVEYTIQATQGLKYHLTKVLAVHDGLLAYPTEYGTVYTIDSLGTFDVDISGGNIRLLVTPAAVTTTNYKIKFTAFKV